MAIDMPRFIKFRARGFEEAEFFVFFCDAKISWSPFPLAFSC